MKTTATSGPGLVAVRVALEMVGVESPATFFSVSGDDSSVMVRDYDSHVIHLKRNLAKEFWLAYRGLEREYIAIKPQDDGAEAEWVVEAEL